MDKLLKQLQRDFKRNPKKAGMLGLLFLVAGWFWIDLIFPKQEKRPVKPTAATAAPVAAVVSPATVAAAPTLRWQDLRRALETDPRMQSVSLPEDGARRNPFVAVITVDAEFDDVVAERLAEIAAEQEASTITPEEASPLLNTMPLVLSSTIVGGRKSRAVINGRGFDLGATIGVKNELPIVLTVVEPRRVIIEWNGSRRELRILRPGEEPTASLSTGALLQ